MITRRTFLAAAASALAVTPRALAADAPPAAGAPLPRMFSAHLQEGGHKLAFALGQHGAYVISSRPRWDQLVKTLQAHNCQVSDLLRSVDFEKENLACVFHYGDEGDQFYPRRMQRRGVDARPDAPDFLDAQFGMAYIIYKQRRALSVGVWRMTAVPVPKLAVTRVSVWTFHPQNGGSHPTIDQAALAWEHTLTPDDGEAIGFLAGQIKPKAATIKPGEDIQLDFTLNFANPCKDAGGNPFTPLVPKSVHVWDGKYSNGHRNHAFEVTTPDGKIQTLRPPEREWDKNAPHPVEIAPGKPYTLPNWREGETAKSLKALGLDTTKPGRYEITGVYQETGEPQGNTPEMWGGVLRTNTVTVEVK